MPPWLTLSEFGERDFSFAGTEILCLCSTGYSIFSSFGGLEVARCDNAQHPTAPFVWSCLPRFELPPYQRRNISDHGAKGLDVNRLCSAYPISFHRSCAGLDAQDRHSGGKARSRPAECDRRQPQQHRKDLNLNPVFAGDGDLG